MSFDSPDYRDHFTLAASEPIPSIDHFVDRLALRQPAWLIRLSTGLTSREAVDAAVASMKGGEGSAIGNWKVVGRTSNSVTFAEDMHIMRYRLTYTLVEATKVTASTEVVQQSRWFGPIYWSLAVPMHKRFLQRMLRNAGGTGSSTSELKLTIQ